MTDFRDEQDVATRLAAVMTGLTVDLVVTDSLAVRDAIAASAHAPSVDMAVVVRYDQGAVVTECPTATRVAVALVGVETGRTAAALADHLRAADAQWLALVCGVLPRSSRHALGGRYDEYIGLVQPLAPRALRWHIG